MSFQDWQESVLPSFQDGPIPLARLQDPTNLSLKRSESVGAPTTWTEKKKRTHRLYKKTTGWFHSASHYGEASLFTKGVIMHALASILRTGWGALPRRRSLLEMGSSIASV
jgi:hypothetical protein